MLKYPVLNVSNDHEFEKLLSKLSLTTNELMNFYRIMEDKVNTIEENREELLEMMASSGNDNYKIMLEQLEKNHLERKLKEEFDDEDSWNDDMTSADDNVTEYKKDEELETFIKSAEDILSKSSSKEVLENIYNTLKDKQSLNQEQQTEIEELLIKLENKIGSYVSESKESPKFEKICENNERIGGFYNARTGEEKHLKSGEEHNDYGMTYTDMDNGWVRYGIIPSAKRAYITVTMDEYIKPTIDYINKKYKDYNVDKIDIEIVDIDKPIIRKIYNNKIVEDDFHGYDDEELTIFEVGDKVIFNDNGKAKKGKVIDISKNAGKYYILASDNTTHIKDGYDMILDREELDEDTVYDHSWYEIKGQKYPKRTKCGVIIKEEPMQEATTTTSSISMISKPISNKKMSRDLDLFKDYVEKGLKCTCSSNGDTYKYEIIDGDDTLTKNGKFVNVKTKKGIVDCVCNNYKYPIVEGSSYQEAKLLMEDNAITGQSFFLPDNQNMKFGDGTVIAKGSEIVISNYDDSEDKYLLMWGDDSSKWVTPRTLKSILRGCDGVSSIIPLLEDSNTISATNNPTQPNDELNDTEKETKIKDNTGKEGEVAVVDNDTVEDKQTIVGLDDSNPNEKKVIVKDPATGKIKVVDMNQIKFKEG